jgi:hypothetical protein
MIWEKVILIPDIIYFTGSIKMNLKKLVSSIDRKFLNKSNILAFSIIIILLGSCFLPLSSSNKVNQTYEQFSIFTEGQFLYSPMWSTTTFLREYDGSLNRSWTSIYKPGVAVWWLGEGAILRTIWTGGFAGGSGGGVQIVQWDGTITWDFRYDTGGNRAHHDVKSLPNGNVLLIAWETKTRNEAIAAGRNPNYVGSQGIWPDHIIEVQPTGPSSGEIVWEWHAWDHLIQDFDQTKANYGVVGNHPELIDINFVTSSQQDLMHTNSVDYNEDFDQILISVHNYNEIWVIDHSTTTEEAAGHTGGNSGKGGDLLYRWGNPQAYDRGNSGNKKLFSQHDTSWIKKGCPGEGDILVFNNGVGRGYSTVDQITPPVNDNGEYYLEEGQAYGPTSQTWIYTANPPNSFYASHISGAWRLPDGNTLITNGETGKIFEVTPEGATVWQYNTGGQVFKVVYIPPEEPPEPDVPDLDCSGSLSWTKVEPGATVNGIFKVQNIGDTGSLLNWKINNSLINWGTWSFNPESGVNLTPENGELTVHVSMVAPNEQNTEFEGYIRVENEDNPDDFDLVPVNLKTPKSINEIHTTIYNFIIKIINLFSEKIYNYF